MRTLIVYRLGSLGDTLVALPCFRRIAEKFPHHRRIALTNFPVASNAAPLESILAPSGLIDGVIEYPVGLRSPKALFELRRRLRQLRPELLIYLPGDRNAMSQIRDRVFFRLCGIRRIIGSSPWSAARANRIDPISGEVEPEAERLARLLSDLGPIDLSDRRSWDLAVTAEEEEAADRALAPIENTRFFAVNMGGKVIQKDWGEANWHRLITDLAAPLERLALVVVGSQEDRQRADQAALAWPHRSLNLCGALTPRASAAVLARADFFVGHDSGPLHLAATMGTPCIGIFGAYNRPRKWHPYGEGHRVIHDMRGVAAISVEEVHAAVASVATRRKSGPIGLPLNAAVSAGDLIGE